MRVAFWNTTYITQDNMHICTYTYMHKHTHYVIMHTHMYACTCAHTQAHVRTLTHTYIPQTQVCTHTCTYVYVCTTIHAITYIHREARLLKHHARTPVWYNKLHRSPSVSWSPVLLCPVGAECAELLSSTKEENIYVYVNTGRPFIIEECNIYYIIVCKSKLQIYEC